MSKRRRGGRSLRAVQAAYLAYVVTVLSVTTAGLAVHYQHPQLIGSPQMLELLHSLAIPEALVTTISFTSPFAGAALLAGAVFLGRRDDTMALLFAAGLLGLFSFWSGSPRAVAAAIPALAALATVTEVLALMCAVLLVFLFPDGRFRPRWTLPVAVGVCSVLVLVPDVAATARLLAVDLQALTPWKVMLAVVVVAIFVVTGAVAQTINYRRHADPVQRQQQRWILSGLATMLFASVAVLLVSSFGGGHLTGWPLLAMGLFSPVLPATAAVALFRYRLFDLDRIVSRTVSWTALSALLGAAYLALVVILQAVLAPFTGGSDLAVALSTLSVAGLFSPTRRRLQHAVDRRFYRSRYDARQIVEHFGHTVRQDVELERLVADVVDVVQHTLRPAAVSVWIRQRASTGSTSVSGREPT